jgi:two-component system, OmpR family, catabolic regulation response regulator CreB
MIISEPVGQKQTRSNQMHSPITASNPDLNNDSAAILLIEDDPAIAETIGFALRQGGFDVQWCAQGLLGLAKFQEQAPDLVILDVGLPDLGGFEVCRRIRQINQTPVLFLTAHSDEIDRIQGFELGADDYISKPFSPRELVSRVRAILRRAGSSSLPAVAPTDLLTSGSIRCFMDQARVMVGQTTLSLTRTEFKLLEHLMRTPLRVFSREQLLNALQGAGSPTGDRAIDTHIKTLRAKIDQAKSGLDPIKTHRGLGYSFEPES